MMADQHGSTESLRGFIDPTATDLSVLGRDVLNHFDLIISRRQNEIFLLTPRHQYHIERDG